jgi:hypothetical protein
MMRHTVLKKQHGALKTSCARGHILKWLKPEGWFKPQNASNRSSCDLNNRVIEKEVTCGSCRIDTYLEQGLLCFECVEGPGRYSNKARHSSGLTCCRIMKHKTHEYATIMCSIQSMGYPIIDGVDRLKIGAD